MNNEKEINIRKYWDNLPPMLTYFDVPKLPIPLLDYQIDKLIECGAIPKNELVIGIYYYGRGRGMEKGLWTGKDFEYDKFAFGYSSKATQNHFEDDNGFALFVPLKIWNND